MITMPWNNSTAPNLMIEVTDCCNIRCDVCYKRKGGTFKTLERIERELNTAFKHRRLHTITISGGEPTLHPDLCGIVRLIKSRSLHVFLLTNGTKITADYLGELKEAGLDSILYHVDAGQQRDDLPANPSFDDIKNKLDELISIAASLNVDASVSMTLYRDRREFARRLTDYFFNYPDLSFLFVARAFDFSCGIASDRNMPADTHYSQAANEFCDYLESEYGIEPYGHIPSANANHSCWVSFFVPVIYNCKGISLFRIRSNVSDIWLMKMIRVLTGRYIHKTSQRPFVTFMRVLINAVTSFEPVDLMRFYSRLFGRNSVLRHKMIVYDDGPFIDEYGRVVSCLYCPTAVVRDDTIVPCCREDYDISKGAAYEDSYHRSAL